MEETVCGREDSGEREMENKRESRTRDELAEEEKTLREELRREQWRHQPGSD